MELPLFYTEKMKKLLKDEFEEYIKSFDEQSESGIRINTLKISADEFKNTNIFELRNVPWCKNGFYCSDDERPAKNYHTMQDYLYSGTVGNVCRRGSAC